MLCVRGGYWEPIDDDRRRYAIEGRWVLNPFETALVKGYLWLREVWFEAVTCRLGRVNCRLFRHHNLTCRGRRDHSILGVGLVDPDRWNGWPRR